MSLQTPFQKSKTGFYDAPTQEVVTPWTEGVRAVVISKGQGSKLSITILLSVFIPIYSTGTAVVSGVPPWK